jgi:hypothetical protein
MRVYHFISEEYALDVIADQRIKVSMIDDLNDPFELHAVDLSNSEYREEFKDFKKHMTQITGILCFSKRWKSPLLWSHYANKHKGVALEFDVLDKVAHPIRYRKKRYVLDLERARKQSYAFSDDEIKELWFTKYEQWDYEEEIRVVLSKPEFYHDKGNYFYDLGNDIHLTGCILGPLCNISISKIERCLPKDMQITVTKSRLAFRSFDVVKNKLFKTVHLKGNV